MNAYHMLDCTPVWMKTNTWKESVSVIIWLERIAFYCFQNKTLVVITYPEKLRKFSSYP